MILASDVPAGRRALVIRSCYTLICFLQEKRMRPVKRWKLSILLVFLMLAIATSVDTRASSSQVQLNPICGRWLIVQVYAGAFTFPAKVILPDGAANPYIVYGGPDLVVDNYYYCIYDPVVELISPPDRTKEGYSISQKITGWSTIQPAGGQPPSAEFDAWPQSGSAPLSVSMHIVSTNNIISCLWEYGDGTMGTSCDAYHDHVYSSAGSYTVKLTVTGPGGSNTRTRSNYITVTAAAVCYTLTKSVNPSNSGSIIAFPIPNCADGKYAAGTQLSLVVTPLSGYQFISWGGSLSGNANPATLTIDADKNVTANFNQSSFCSAVTEIPQTECEALIAFYNSTNGATWSDNSNWLDTTSPCGWFGVTCNNNHVVQLVLPNNQLNGALPEQLSTLTNLQTLSLYVNQLSGSIPPTVGSLTNLISLSLSDNQLSGSIPASLGSLSNLQLLHAHGNQFSGNIPTQLGYLTNLRELDLAKNQLSGSIPTQIGNLTKLEKLGLGSNQLSGNIPPEMGKLTKLVGINLSNNQLSGNLPVQVGDLINLDFLSIENNLLNGALPVNLVNLNKLIHFWFNNTNLCEPGDSFFQLWLVKISDLNRTGVTCTDSKDLEPVIFIPGIAGSQLRSDNGVIWPTLFATTKLPLTLEPGSKNNSIYADDAIRYFDIRLFPDPKVYGPFLERVTKDDVGYKEGIDLEQFLRNHSINECAVLDRRNTLFVFPWDWRYGVVDINDTNLNQSRGDSVTQLKQFIECIQLIHSGKKVNIVAHSMGGLLARMYVLRYPNHPIKNIITIGTPWLGAPKAISMLLNGNFDGRLLTSSETRSLLEFFPSAHQLLPSQQYFNLVRPNSPFAILPNAGSKRVNPVDYSNLQRYLADRYRSPLKGPSWRSSVQFVANNEKLYQQLGFTDWSGDTGGVTYHVLYGERWNDDTISQTQEAMRWISTCPRGACAKLISVFDVIKTASGDGTVPVLSASWPRTSGEGNSLVKVHPFQQRAQQVPRGGLILEANIDHGNLLSNLRIQNCVLAILKSEGGWVCDDESNLTSAAPQLSVKPRHIELWGLRSITVTNGVTVSGNLLEGSQHYSQFPGLSIERTSDTSIHVVFPSDNPYSFTMISEENVIIQDGLGLNQSPEQITRYMNIATQPRETFILGSAQFGSLPLYRDSDSDGVIDTIIEPSAVIIGDATRDISAPDVTINYDSTNNLVTIATQDDISGVGRVFYSLDSQNFESYLQPFILPSGVVAVYAQAEDKMGNQSPVMVQSIPSFPPNYTTVLLPIIIR